MNRIDPDAVGTLPKHAESLADGWRKAYLRQKLRQWQKAKRDSLMLAGIVTAGQLALLVLVSLTDETETLFWWTTTFSTIFGSLFLAGFFFARSKANAAIDALRKANANIKVIEA